VAGAVGVAVGTEPVSDSTLPLAFFTASVTGEPLPPPLCLFAPPLWPLPVAPWPPGVLVDVGAGVPVDVGVGVAVSWTATVGAGVAVGVPSAEPRSTIEATGAGRPGICTWDTGVPGGTSTVTVSCWPVTSVTRT
jgi:hypothetical protein